MCSNVWGYFQRSMKAIDLSFVEKVMNIYFSLLLFCCIVPGSVRSENLHSTYDALLQEQVTDTGMVDYQALVDSPLQLKTYLEQLKSITREDYEEWVPERQLAFLLNLYNAATLQLIVDHYPVESIKDIGGWLSGPWDQKVVPFLGSTVTLNHLEHEIIRKEFAETPETHFALVCAAMGCPPLRREAYTAKELIEQLQDQKSTFLSNPEKNRKNADQERLYLSPIFKWYAKDFEQVSGSVQNYISTFWPEVDETWNIRYTPYDWSLNENE